MQGRRIFFTICFLAVSACSSSSTRNTERVHPSVYAMDLFSVDRQMPQHESQGDKEFYFKKCVLEKRTYFSSQAEYSCSY